MAVNAYTNPSFSNPSVSDNSGGIKEFTVVPENANTTMTIERAEQTVTYRVIDHADNEETCSFKITVKGMVNLYFFFFTTASLSYIVLPFTNLSGLWPRSLWILLTLN